MPVHEDTIHVEVAIVEVEIAACAIKRFTSRQHHRRRGEVFTAEALHGASVEIESAKADVCVVARAGCSGCLHGITAGRIALQIEAIGKASINIFEV